MTVAVCLQCGGLKRSAWATCRKCGFTPSDDESMTKHLLCTDHFLDKKELQAVSEKVQAGEEVEFSEDVLKEAWIDASQVKRANRNCAIGCVVFLAIVVVLSIVVWYWAFGS